MKKNIFHQANLFIRSCLFSIVMIIGIVFYSFICLLFAFFPIRVRYHVVTAWTRFNTHMLKIICRIDYRLDGLENIPAHQNGIIMSKHQSTWETFFLPGFFHQAAIIVKRELLWIPFFGWGLATLSPIAIDRANKFKAMDQIIVKGKKYLDQGRWVVVFPEGTRVEYGKVGHYRLGGIRLAIATGYPIFPVAHNAGRFWPRRQFIKHPGTVQVVIGPKIETQGRVAEDVLAEVKNWIETTMLRIG